ncbi:hypothetical protein Salat_1843900 [Sesamum alatum]|uniref:Uncharacterized protein n=1 Tax=Sesamum alatum TaxID=300844 RepID=A0AAE2CHW3_9LAMI|nr:hypothetical protein Salat_1843900 [Sesamum alatum]
MEGGEMVVKEEQVDITPPEPEISSGGAVVSSSSAATDQSDGPNSPTELNSGPMQQAAGSSSANNSVENNGVPKRKRKPKSFPGYEVFPFPSRRRPHPLLPPPPANGSDSRFDFNRTIDAIKSKYGDIDKDCSLKSECMRKLNIYGICNVLRELQKKNIDELDIASIEAFYDVIRDLEKLNIGIGWLRQRFDQIKDAIKSREEAMVLNLERIERVKNVEEKMKEVEELKSKIEKLEDQMAREDLVIEKLNEDINIRTSKVQQLQGKSLTDGLI